MWIREGVNNMAYIVTKEAGNNRNVVLLNDVTSSSVILGRISTDMLEILKEDGHDIDPDELTKEWSIKVSEEIGKKLAGLAFKTKKPIREQKKKVTPEEDAKTKNKQIDAMDVLLGLANYV